MLENNKNYRIRTNIGDDKVLNVQLKQDYDLLEILSLKINQNNAYKLHTSNYGVVIGRVIANGGFGIPNAKISVFIPINNDDITDPVKAALYPYSSTMGQNNDGIKYNLLPNYNINECYQPVGTFEKKEYILDNDDILEIYDTYYKFTTRTNNAGDYMIFGVPTGNQIIHVDLDLSDIGFLSQRPRDLIYKGYNINQFENPNQFKRDTNLNSLSQIYTQDNSVNVYPYWGDDNDGVIAITRNDIQIQYKFEPTCVFMGSIVSDAPSNAISKKCKPSDNMGVMGELISGNGTIEMIRKTPDNNVESYQIQGNELINGDGVWCYQIPMNLDYVTTDEYGNIVPTDDPSKGIPTRTRVRFRIGMQDIDNVTNNSVQSRFLVPNNPQTSNELDYVFGTLTKDESYKDLFWNNVYSVKSYIPRFQKGNSQKTTKFTGFKQVNHNNNLNPIPYNNLRIKMSLMFMIMCAIIKAYVWVVSTYNWFMTFLPEIEWNILGFRLTWFLRQDRTCMYLGDGICPDMESWYFAPNCGRDKQNNLIGGADNSDVSGMMKNTLNAIRNLGANDTSSIDYQNSNSDSSVCLTRNTNHLIQCIEISLAQEYKVIQFDFYNDWINGLLYLPRWNREVKKKKNYLFGLIRVKERINACTVTSFSNTRDYTQQCALEYEVNNNGLYTNVITPNGCGDDYKQNCHRNKGRKQVAIFGAKGGVVDDVNQNSDGLTLYYFKPYEFNFRDSVEIKTPLFATDIILIGSLNDCDLYGIPQTFKSLTSTSYQMPNNLALTNMDSEGFLYGDGNSLCYGTTIDDNANGINIIPQDLTIQAEAMKNSDSALSNTITSFSDKIAYTEVSGVDWGYIGPGQDKAFVSGSEVSVGNSIKELYFPGGHFLGISCLNSQTNIKSCVNLVRACEQGVWLSQRQEQLSSIKDNGGDISEYNYIALSPNGLISKDEIIDEDFRKSFATMNGNRLKTVKDDNGYLKYDFIYNSNSNFNGELSKPNVLGPQYFHQVSDNYNISENITPPIIYSEYRRAFEATSDGYYKFRFGITKDDNTDKELRSNFLISKNNSVGLPIYANSFYFYFGIRDGSTAIDEFNKQYFSNCISNVEVDKEITVSSNNSSICGDVKGSVDIELAGVIPPFEFLLYKDGSLTPIDISGKLTQTTPYKYTVNDLNYGSYEISVVDGNNIILNNSFIINEDRLVTSITVNNFVKDCTNYTYSELINIIDRVDIGGSLNFNNTFYDGVNRYEIGEEPLSPHLIIRNRETDTYTTTDNSIVLSTDIKNVLLGDSYNYVPYVYNDGAINLWKQNTDYDVFAIYRCEGDIYDKYVLIGTYVVDGPLNLNFSIGSSKLTYINDFRDYINDDIKNTTPWWTIDGLADLFKYNESDSLIDKKLKQEKTWVLKKSLFKENIDGATSLPITPIGGFAPWETHIIGQGEALVDNSYILKEQSGPETNIEIGADYSLSISTIYTPTVNYKTMDDGGNTVERLPFGVRVNDISYPDSSEGIIPNDIEDKQLVNYVEYGKYFTIPIIYKPFYYNVNIWKTTKLDDAILPNKNGVEQTPVGTIVDFDNYQNGLFEGLIYNGITFDELNGSPTTKLVKWLYGENDMIEKYVTFENNGDTTNDLYINNTIIDDYNTNGRIVKFNALNDNSLSVNNVLTVSSLSPLDVDDDEYSSLLPTSYTDNSGVLYYSKVEYDYTFEAPNHEITINGVGTTNNLGKYFLFKISGLNNVRNFMSIIYNMATVDYDYINNLIANPISSDMSVEEITMVNNKVILSSDEEDVYIFIIGVYGRSEIEAILPTDELYGQTSNELNRYRVHKMYHLLQLPPSQRDVAIFNITTDSGMYISPGYFPTTLVNDAIIDWGDGNIETIPTGTIHVGDERLTHTYASSGDYEVKITIIGPNDFNFGYVDTIDNKYKETLNNISLLTPIGQSSGVDMVKNCVNLTKVSSVSLKNITDATNMFSNCRSLVDVELNDTESLIIANSMFADSGLQTLNTLNTPNMVDATNMFNLCQNLIIGPTLTTSNVVNMSRMFNDCYNLTSIPHYDTTNVENTSEMFNKCYALTSIPLLNTINVVNANAMFRECYALTEIPLIDTTNVIDMGDMYYACESLSTATLTNTSNVVNMGDIFANCSNLTAVSIADTSKVENMLGMFFNCYLLTDVSLGGAQSVNDTTDIFADCLELLNVSGFNGLKTSLIITDTISLTYESAKNIINDLAYVSDSPELVFYGETYDLLTPSDIQIATDKGWVL